MTPLNTRNLTLSDVYRFTLTDVHRLLGFQKLYNGSFTPLLSLEPLTDYEQQEIIKIQNVFDRYLTERQALVEGEVRSIAMAPLLLLTGYYHSSGQLKVEESIAGCTIKDEDPIIKGHFDITAIFDFTAIYKQEALTNNLYFWSMHFWILVMEEKSSLADPLVGLPKLLIYAYQSLEHQQTIWGLEHQQAIWGLVTNGVQYQFVYIHSGTPITYQLMPLLSLFETESSQQLVQVLKAIAK